MTKRNASFALNNWYHCYNRSIDKRTSFEDSQDYQRFLELLYLANNELPLRRGDIGTRNFEEILTLPRGEKLVSIGAFCLMPGHFHLALKEVVGGGISAFMRKIGTAYTMYFNARHAREGNLFLKPFQSIPVSTEHALPCLMSYIHCNPAVLYEREWRTDIVVDPQFLEEHLVAYRYSSLGVHMGIQTPISTILDKEIFSVARTLPIQKMLREARQYYANTDVP